MAYQAGQAWIAVAPSLRGFHRKVRSELQRELAGLNVEIPVGADTSEARREVDRLRAELGRLRDAKVGVDVDAGAAESRISQIEARLRQLGASEPTVDVDADTAAATTQLAAVDRQVSRLDGRRAEVNVDVDRSGNAQQSAFFLSRQINGLVLLGGMIAPTFVPAFGAAAVAAGGFASSLTAATIGVGGLIAVAAPAIGAVSEALKAQEAAEKSAATTAGQSARQRVQAAHAAQQAARRVSDAQRDADRTAEEGARRVAKAREDVARAAERAAETVEQAQRRVADAEQSLVLAQQDQRRAQEALTEARRDALRALQDLREQVDDLNRSEESAEIGVLEAEQRLNELRDETGIADIQRAELGLAEARERQAAINADATATDLDRQRALLGVQDAEDRLASAQQEAADLALERRKAELRLAEAEDRVSDVRRDKTRRTSELNDAERRGVNGHDLVVSAQDRLQTTTRGVTEATRDLADARSEQAQAEVEAARITADAERGLADARRDAAQANEDAARQVSDALRAQAQQAEMAALQTEQGTAAQRNLAYAMGQLTPMQQALMAGWISLRDAFTQWARALEPAVIPVLVKGMGLLQKMLPFLTPIVEASAAAFSGLLDRASAALEAPFWRRWFGWLADTAGPSITTFGQVIGNLAKGFAGLLMAFGPTAKQINAGLVSLTERFADWGATLGKNNGFRVFVDYVRQTWPRLKATLSALWSAFVNIIRALAPLGGPTLLALQAVATVIGSMPPGLLAAIAGGILSIGTAFKFAGAAMAVLNANPIIAVIAAVSALVTWLVYTWQTSEEFRDRVKAILAAIRGFWQNTVGRIIGWVRTGWDWITTKTTALKNGVVRQWNALGFGVQAVWGAIKRNTIDRLVDGFRWVRDGAVALKDGVVGAWRTMRDRLGGIWQWIWENAIRPLRDGFQKVWNKAVAVKDGIVKAWGTVAETIGNVFRTITDGIKSALNWVFDKINSWMIKPLNVLLRPFFEKEPPIEPLKRLHSGGMVEGRGERPYMLLGGEGVLNPQAVKDIGGPQVVDAINRGEGFGGGGWIPDWMQKTSDAFTWPLRKGWEVLSGQWVDDAIYDGVKNAVRGALSLLNPLRDNRPEMPLRSAVGAADDFGSGIVKWAGEFTGRLSKRVGTLEKDGPGRPDLSGNYAFPLPRGSYRVGVGINGYPGHTGHDFPVPTGTKVFSPFAGQVSQINLGNRSYGKYASVISPSGMQFIAAHLSRLGQTGMVRRGEVIGWSGSTGNSTGPHLHAEFRDNGRVIDPRRLLKFDNGGVLPQGLSLAFNNTGQRERVLDPAQTRAYERGNGRGFTVEQMTVQAWSDRFSLDQVERELAFKGAL